VTHSCWQYQIWISDDLNADLNPEQRVTLKTHVASCPSCSKLQQQLSREHELMNELSKDLERRLQRVQERALEEIRHAQQAPRTSSPWPQLARIAAILLLMISILGITVSVSQRTADPRSATAYSQKVTDALAQAQRYYQEANISGLNSMLSFDHDRVKLAVIDYLAEIGDDTSVLALQNLASTVPSAEIQAAIKRSITRIQERLKAAKAPIVEIPVVSQPDTEPAIAASVNEPGPLQVAVPSPNEPSEDVSQVPVKTTHLSIFDSVTQDPIDRARVVVDVNGILLEYFSDPNGMCTVDIESPTYTRISVSKDQYVSKEFGTQAPGGGYYRYMAGAQSNRQMQTKDIPDALTVALVPAFTIGGTVMSEEGDPIEGVKLSVSFSVQDDIEADWTHAPIIAVTDSNGVWENPEANSSAYRVRVSATHDRYVQTDRIRRAASISLLKQKQHITTMQRQRMISGRIVDEQGNGIKTARVYLASGSSCRTEEDGRFEMRGVLEGDTQVVVVANGYAPVSLYQTIADGHTMLVTLKAGHSQRLIIIDPQGKPIEGARISSVTSVGTKRISSGWGTGKHGSDANGMIEGLGMLGQVLCLTVQAEGYTTRENVQVECSESLHQLTLASKGQLLLSVFDAETNDRIGEYSVVLGESKGEEGIIAWRHYENVDASYTRQFDQNTGIHCCLLVDAEGYLSKQIEIISNHESRIERSLSLHKGNDMSGRLFDPNGDPKANTDVLVCFDDVSLVYMQNRKLDTTYTRQFLKYRPVKTDDLGRFELDIADKHFALMAASDEGFAMVRDHSFLATGEMHMQAWGSIEGILHKGNQVAPYEEIQLEYLPPQGFEGLGVRCYEHTLTDHAGYFRFNHVRPGPAFVCRVLNQKPSNRTDVAVLSGETSFVSIAGGGRPVLVAYSWPKELPLPWSFTYDFTICRDADEALKYDYAVKVDRSGQIQIDDVLPGTYTLSGSFAEGKEVFASLTHRFDVPEIKDESDYRSPLNVGELSLMLVRETGSH
jgi:hypothetical protein